MTPAHLDGCPAARLERFMTTIRTGRWQVTRCMDCGAQAQLQLAAAALDLDPDLQPANLARTLSPAQRSDPDVNPLHPLAGGTIRRPTSSLEPS